MGDKINVCCGYFYLLLCADTEEHLHIGCDPKSGLDDNPIIDNEHARIYCIGENYKGCPYYPKRG